MLPLISGFLAELGLQKGQAKVWPAAEAYNHIPGGGNILDMDGHVLFERYPGEQWPVRTDAVDVFTQILEALG